MDVEQILKDAVRREASDIYVIAGMPVAYKIDGRIVQTDGIVMMPPETERFLREIYQMADGRDPGVVVGSGDDDFSFALKGVSRFRVNAFKQRGSLAAVIRLVKFALPEASGLGIPEVVLGLADRTKGLVLVTGCAGSGRSTTLACIIDRINHTRKAHVITLEDPLEYLYKHDQSIVTQREITSDTESYGKALRAALHQSPDVIQLGSMRDCETVSIAMAAAEAGHLLLTTMHTAGAANTINRIIDMYPPEQHQQVRVQLALVLQAVVSQQIVPKKDGGVAAVFEIMTVNSAIRSMIRESKVHQIDSVIYNSAGEGMRSMDGSLLELLKKGIISAETAITYSTNPEIMEKKTKL